MHERRIEQLAHHGGGEVAVRLLDQQQVGVGMLVAQVGERILVASLAFDLAGIGVEQPRLPDQVERQVGERDVLLQHRRLARPFRQPMAEDQRIVGKAEEQFEQIGLSCRMIRYRPRLLEGPHQAHADTVEALLIDHICPTSSGTL